MYQPIKDSVGSTAVTTNQRRCCVDRSRSQSATVFPVNLATVIYIFYPSGLFKRVVALHMAKKRERRQRCAARKAMMVDQLKKKAESFVTKLENRQG